VGVARLAASKFLVGLTSQYGAMYTVGLGADSVQLGSLSSVGGAIGALISAPVGWLMDRHGIKRLFLLAIVFAAGGSLFYALAPDWRFLVVATILASVAASLSNTGCRVICADSVQSQDRVTTQNVCSTLAALAGLISPLVGAYLVTVFGGMTVEGIRPLYVLQFAGYGLIFLFVAIQLREPQEGQLAGGARFGFIADFRHLFEGRRDLEVDRHFRSLFISYGPVLTVCPAIRPRDQGSGSIPFGRHGGRYSCSATRFWHSCGPAGG
jgi:MFS family permease